MAWRIDTHLVRGEIDNRIRGKISGRFWFLGRSEPVELELKGNASRDLAGRRLFIVNPRPEPGLDDGFASEQTGVVGEFTASRKRKVLDIPLDQLGEYYAAKRPVPWHWGNCVYFEWFSASNGHVIIESAEYQLTVSTESTWEMTAEEESQQSKTNAEAMNRFFEELGFLSSEDVQVETGSSAEPFDLEAELEDDASENWKREEPLSEEEADALMADSDQLADRLLARLDEAADQEELEKILEEELERRRKERRDDEEEKPWTSDIEAAAREIAKDPDFQEQMQRRHPLSERARELAIQLMEYGETGTWAPAGAGPEHPAADLINQVMKGGGKLAGALDAREWPPTVDECALCIAWLKRAKSHFEDALVAGDFCREQKLVPVDELLPALTELQGLVREISALIEDLRERLARGFD
jgi:hypothetical protein